MPPRAGSKAAAVLVGMTLLAAACGPGEPVDAEQPSRPPLDDPPDPGPVPVSDGLTDADRERIVGGTVRVTGRACGRMVEGSGFAVGEGLIATSAHVLVGVEDPTVETVSQVGLAAVPVAFEPVDDLALLRVPDVALVPFELGDALDGTVGTLVGWEDGRPDPTPFRIDRPVTVRIDAVIGHDRVERRSWLLAAELDSGDSGAALVDGEGVVVGIAYATTRREAGVAYATRASRLEALLETADLSAAIELPDCGA